MCKKIREKLFEFKVNVKTKQTNEWVRNWKQTDKTESVTFKISDGNRDEEVRVGIERKKQQTKVKNKHL